MVNLQITFGEPHGATDAPCLVLGHSLGTSSALWADAAALLAKHFRVVTWDLPGHGASPAADDAFTISDLSDAVVGQLGARGVSKFLYAGVSIGGTVGMDVARRHAERVDAVAVISAGANVDAPAAWAERAALVRSEGTEALAAGSLQRWFAPATREHRGERAASMIEELRRADDRSYAWACEALAAYDVSPDLSRMDVRALALWGEYDQLVPERKSAELARGLPRGSLQCVPDAAHAAPLEQPTTVSDLLVDFFLGP
ncbi:alpha/beta fold hydrolase [Micromonospora olivasterospora]|uniref:3-oxoadipate enol-lactonase/3-oxoadipate enol-lactonase/4-carboxymuconolactone decarboxylase n=1 Tax=Micromonospora olivasterospora TaxID=1880 RepID=A0A562IIQ0_MICOL|nr:alpha/beta fold hydrolase [Micromonospora olivasterospora]TWH70810.1 3-oxoadipate enol-lactonase/3-oxoadipate enol-lactonase/4-carboxymuconolactone decarboxylase [Micromonospora olivasterospora]